ncbi:hypothetical protein RO3G_10909 [Rhizopus delemar RA 99-880]|uniref:Uncharacterized protein n=1 Tax=Rhizopus delemar (strain RA 99-880 / ATCC MYA-4621 / FGSC 9543 / NRRL 43880) TaxID=246409 RepID=I1CCL8_RHIO9|nr:hypothetical protein RO3G_10909 [Rhizopus delemar RA 99-880]|eukprot:EIE86198.1 hypothetical protein RO3G_10909 [Rhizopus delemar RA 99-880]
MTLSFQGIYRLFEPLSLFLMAGEFIKWISFFEHHVAKTASDFLRMQSVFVITNS